MSHEEYGSLFGEGLRAPEDVSEVSDSDTPLTRKVRKLEKLCGPS